MRRILLVANHTAAAAPLREAVLREMERGPALFTLIVPAIDAHQRTLTWDENESWREAEGRLQWALEILRRAGATVEGRVGPHDAFEAVRDALRETQYHGVIVSTFDPGISKWLRLDLPSRIARESGLPVTHIIAPRAA